MSIRDWPASERPREKLLDQGAAALSDAELLAIFLRTGVAGKSAVDLARFPCLSHLPFFEATLQPGDCLIIPRHWMHHVASDGGPDGRPGFDPS